MKQMLVVLLVGIVIHNTLQMTNPMGVQCQKKLDSCPKGHEMERCTTTDGEEGRYCKQCGEVTFQPNENRFGDSCRLRRTCAKYRMKYKEFGDKTRNAECMCELGYHFENEDQRACVPNKVCAKGFGQGIYEDGRRTGTCEDCKQKKMYSDTSDTINRCKPLTNCEKQSRCTFEKSNGTNDNKCGPVVDDVSKCDTMNFDDLASNRQAAYLGSGAIIGIVLASVFILAIILLLCCYRRRYKARRSVPTQDEMDSMLKDIIRQAGNDEKYCSKVLTVGQKEIEDRINNQIWALPKELFRKHPIDGKADVLIEKYKGQQHKFAINSYMQDWRGWRGNTSFAIEELVECLKNDKVKREDIVYEIVLSVKDDLPEVSDESYIGVNKRPQKAESPSSLCACLFPCAFNEDKYKETNETSNMLIEKQSPNEKGGNPMKVFISPPSDPPNDGGDLTPHEAGDIYRHGPLPSAPVIDDLYENPNEEVKGKHFYDRSDSLPVQASS